MSTDINTDEDQKWASVPETAGFIPDLSQTDCCVSEERGTKRSRNKNSPVLSATDCHEDQNSQRNNLRLSQLEGKLTK